MLCQTLLALKLSNFFTGTDESRLIYILAHRNVQQRQEIEKVYKAQFGKVRQYNVFPLLYCRIDEVHVDSCFNPKLAFILSHRVYAILVLQLNHC